MQSPIGLNWDR